jgi:hypothetical protein
LSTTKIALAAAGVAVTAVVAAGLGTASATGSGTVQGQATVIAAGDTATVYEGSPGVRFDVSCQAVGQPVVTIAAGNRAVWLTSSTGINVRLRPDSAMPVDSPRGYSAFELSSHRIPESVSMAIQQPGQRCHVAVTVAHN